MPQTEGDQARVPILLTREQWAVVEASLESYRMFEAEWQLLTQEQRELMQCVTDAIADQLREQQGVGNEKSS